MTTLLDMNVGDEFEQSSWQQVTQDAVNLFADATGDHQWIHIDVERCQKESPFKTTIAHGFLTASMMPKAFEDIVKPHPSIPSMLNYGINSIRFLEPVRVGESVKYAFRLKAVDDKPMGKLFTFEGECRIQGNEKPALVGEFLMLAIIKR